jgi:hypothetical protein
VAAALASVTFTPATVQSQGRTVGTIALTAAAPAAGAVVTLSSSNADVARVPSAVTIAAGSSSGNVNIDVSSVARSTEVTITAAYAGVTKTGTVTVTPPPLEARFTITSPARGPDACAVDDDGGHVDCDFDASRSVGFIDRYLWKIIVGEEKDEYRWDTASAISRPAPRCDPWEKGSRTKSVESFTVDVELRLRGRDGTESSTVRRTIRVYPQKRCGYT